jgi:acyl carrier protein
MEVVCVYEDNGMTGLDAANPDLREQVSLQVRRLIAEFFQIPLERIREETVVEDVQGWDSTSHVAVILAVEEALGTEFDVEKITAFQNVGELIDECISMVSRRA